MERNVFSREIQQSHPDRGTKGGMLNKHGSKRFAPGGPLSSLQMYEFLEWHKNFALLHVCPNNDYEIQLFYNFVFCPFCTDVSVIKNKAASNSCTVLICEESPRVCWGVESMGLLLIQWYTFIAFLGYTTRDCGHIFSERMSEQGSAVCGDRNVQVQLMSEGQDCTAPKQIVACLI